MNRRFVSIMLLLTLVAGLLCAPAGLAESRFTASTPLAEASSNNIKNIQRAAAAINGKRVESGESFSFNQTVGPRTKSQGYVSAENARGVSVTGGGVSQVATTLYLALLRLGSQVEFTQLSTYGQRFEGSYVTDGEHAVITDYSGGTDFEFVNHTSPMTIEMWVSSSALNCVVTLGDGGGKSGGSANANTNANWFGEWSDSAAATYAASVSIPLSGGDGTRENVRLAAKSIDGTQLNTGDVFSFNDIVGPRTKKRGYGTGLNGRGAKVTGGGVAQVASAIWLAVKQMDEVSIVEKSTYGDRYNQDYVKSSVDAIVTDYKSKKDFSFKYNGSGSIIIYTSIVDDKIQCNIAYK